MKCGGWTGDGSVGLELRTQGGYGWDPGVAVGWTMWMERTAGVRGTLEAEFFYCVIEYKMQEWRSKCDLTPCLGWVKAPAMPSETW